MHTSLPEASSLTSAYAISCKMDVLHTVSQSVSQSGRDKSAFQVTECEMIDGPYNSSALFPLDHRKEKQIGL